MELKTITGRVSHFAKSYGLLFLFLAVSLVVLRVFQIAWGMLTETNNLNEAAFQDRMRAVCAHLSHLTTAEEIGTFREKEDRDRPEYIALRKKLIDFANELNEPTFYDRLRVASAQSTAVDEPDPFRDRLSRLATVEELQSFRKQQGMDSPEFAALREKWEDFLQKDGINYVFFLRVDGDSFQYIIDNDPDGDKKSEEGLGHMQPLATHLPGLQPYSTVTHVSKLGDYAAGYENLRSAYAPIRDDGGRIVAYCGIDVGDGDMRHVRDGVKRVFLQELLALIAVLASGLYGFIRYRWEVIKANNANAAKSRFLSRMSHEIRTPMTAVLGMSDLAAINYGKPQGLEHISYIKQAGNNLLSIINGILDISALESGKIRLVSSPYSMSSVLYDILAITRISLKDKTNAKLTFNVSPDLPNALIGDEMRVREILMNLLTNAVKYTPSGFVRLHARGRREGADKVLLTFEVSDSGIGIKEENLKRLFLEFSRIEDKYTKNIEGTGLGLSITQLLCRTMGGDVKVKSTYGVGSTFTATVRQQVEADCPAIGVFNDREVVRPKSAQINFIAPDFSVLVVDDVETNLSVTKGLLGSYRMKVDTCTSGMDALSLVKGREYDLVFMDHMMPEMDGMETVAAIRALGGLFEKLPIAALTANVVVGMKEVFMENGFDDFLPKPIESAKLHELIERWVPIEKRVYTDRSVFSLRHLRGGNRSLAEKRQLAEKRLMAGKMRLGEAVVPSEGGAPSGVSREAAGYIEGLEGIDGIEGLDAARGLESAGGSVSAYRELLDLFCRDVYSRIDFLNTPFAERDTRSFVTHVHALKSASASIGAMALSEEALELEAAGKERRMGAIRQGVGGFRDRVSKLTESIRAVLSTEGQVLGGGRAIDVHADTTIKYAFAKLQKALSDADSATVDILLGELSGMPLDGGLSGALSRVSALASSSEFAEAAAIIEGVMK